MHENEAGIVEAPSAKVPAGSTSVRADADMIIAGLLGIEEKRRKEFGESVQIVTAQLSSQMTQLATGQKQNVYAIEAVAKQIAAVVNHLQILESAVYEKAALSDAYHQEHVIEPMAATLFPVLDLIDDANNAWMDADVPLDTQVIELFAGIRTQLIQFFQIYNIEILRHTPGAKFDAQIMRPAKIMEISNTDLDLCIGKSLQSGFRIVTSNRLLRAESVILYKCKRIDY